jgi:hypothetical protein
MIYSTGLLCLVIRIIIMSYVTVSHEVQNVFVLCIISLIFEFKILIQPFNMIFILKYV